MAAVVAWRQNPLKELTMLSQIPSWTVTLASDMGRREDMLSHRNSDPVYNYNYIILYTVYTVHIHQSLFITSTALMCYIHI